MLICKIEKCANGKQGQYLYITDNPEENFNADGEYVEDTPAVTYHSFILETCEQVKKLMDYLYEIERDDNYSHKTDKFHEICYPYTCSPREYSDGTIQRNFIKNATWYCEYFRDSFAYRYNADYLWTGRPCVSLDFSGLTGHYLPFELIKDPKEFQALVLSKCIARGIKYKKEWFDISTEYAERKQTEREIEELKERFSSKLIDFEILQKEVNEYNAKLEELNKKLADGTES